VIGRNDPCWCGSGKKYKKCHMLSDLKSGTQRPTRRTPRLVKDGAEIEGMRRAGAANGQLMDYVRPMVRPGVATAEIDRAVHAYTVEHGWVPACLGYRKFPRSCCISVNDVVCHGIPSDKLVLHEGDIVNVDLTTIVEGFHGDSSETFMLGDVPSEARELVGTTAQAMLRGIAAVRPGQSLAAVARAIEPYVRSKGCSVVRQYTGHGIGRKFHEHFTVYHHESAEDEQIMMQPGMTFTVEPMINRGEYRVVTDRDDGWTVRTRDGSLSAQFEHTVLVTEDGVEVLTLTPSQRAAGVVLAVEGLKLSPCT
jgi:methionyl aminopeptidase